MVKTWGGADQILERGLWTKLTNDLQLTPNQIRRNLQSSPIRDSVRSALINLTNKFFASNSLFFSESLVWWKAKRQSNFQLEI